MDYQEIKDYLQSNFLSETPVSDVIKGLDEELGYNSKSIEGMKYNIGKCYYIEEFDEGVSTIVYKFVKVNNTKYNSIGELCYYCDVILKVNNRIEYMQNIYYDKDRFNTSTVQEIPYSLYKEKLDLLLNFEDYNSIENKKEEKEEENDNFDGRPTKYYWLKGHNCIYQVKPYLCHKWAKVITLNVEDKICSVNTDKIVYEDTINLFSYKDKYEEATEENWINAKDFFFNSIF